MFRNSFESLFYFLENFRLRLHFYRVLAQLTETARAPVDPAIVDLIDAYRKRCRFPRNLQRSRPTPVFIDQRQRPCAVADLLINSGCGQLAHEISVNQNHALVEQIDFNLLRSWAEQHGLTRQDLALIQPQYIQFSLLGLLLLVLSFANLLVLLIWGRGHVATILLVSAMTMLFLFTEQMIF